MPKQSFLNPEDKYAILGVEKDASAAAIKTAYRKLQLQYHPDKDEELAALRSNVPSDLEILRKKKAVEEAADPASKIAKQKELDEIVKNKENREAQIAARTKVVEKNSVLLTEAYETLSNPVKREAYDKGGVDPVASPAQDNSSTSTQSDDSADFEAEPSYQSSSRGPSSHEQDYSSASTESHSDADVEDESAQSAYTGGYSSSARTFFAPQSAQKTDKYSQGQEINSLATLRRELEEALISLVFFRMALQFTPPRNFEEAFIAQQLKQQSELMMFVVMSALATLNRLDSKQSLDVDFEPDVTSQRVRVGGY